MNDKIIFLHIPKSGGRTLHTILERFYREDKTFTIRVTKTRANNTQDFVDMPSQAREKINLLKGHLSFGLHELMSGSPKYVTFLRSPRERIISFYYYVLMRKKHRLHKTLTDSNMSLYEFVTTVQRSDLHNCQIRFISGLNGTEDEMLARAIENIDQHFSFVGITEQYDESLILLQQLYGWSTPHYKIENKTKNRPTIDQVESKTIEAIDNFNRGDQLLYQYVKKKFDQQVELCPDFKQRLSKLQRANKLNANRVLGFLKRNF